MTQYQIQFDRSAKLAFQGSSLSYEVGVLLHRELDDALGLTEMAAALLADPRTGRNGRHHLAGRLRQSIFSRLAGYEDVADADLERCTLRPGNVHSADGWEEVSRPVLARYASTVRPWITRRRFRADAAVAIPALFNLLPPKGLDYAVRVKGNPKLHSQISWLTKRGPDRPPHHVVRRNTSFHYRAKSWAKPRRVVAMVEFQPGELFSRIGFILTNRSLANDRLLASSNGRGTAEQWIKLGRHALKLTRLSCLRFAANAVRLQLRALACNLAKLLRMVVTPKAIETWSLTSLRVRLIEAGARLARHARHVRHSTFQLAEAMPPCTVVAGILDRIHALRRPPAEVACP